MLKCSTECWILALMYIDRLNVKFPARIIINSYCVHRLLITALLLACKFFDDSFHSNYVFAIVSGVSVTEINALEWEFLAAINFDLTFTPQQYLAYLHEAVEMSKTITN